jgi:hypothetical protein
MQPILLTWLVPKNHRHGAGCHSTHTSHWLVQKTTAVALAAIQPILLTWLVQKKNTAAALAAIQPILLTWLVKKTTAMALAAIQLILLTWLVQKTTAVALAAIQPILLTWLVQKTTAVALAAIQPILLTWLVPKTTAPWRCLGHRCLGLLKCSVLTLQVHGIPLLLAVDVPVRRADGGVDCRHHTAPPHHSQPAPAHPRLWPHDRRSGTNYLYKLSGTNSARGVWGGR